MRMRRGESVGRAACSLPCVWWADLHLRRCATGPVRRARHLRAYNRSGVTSHGTVVHSAAPLGSGRGGSTRTSSNLRPLSISPPARRRPVLRVACHGRPPSEGCRRGHSGKACTVSGWARPRMARSAWRTNVAHVSRPARRKVVSSMATAASRLRVMLCRQVAPLQTQQTVSHRERARLRARGRQKSVHHRIRLLVRRRRHPERGDHEVAADAVEHGHDAAADGRDIQLDPRSLLRAVHRCPPAHRSSASSTWSGRLGGCVRSCAKAHVIIDVQEKLLGCRGTAPAPGNQSDRAPLPSYALNRP
jgi:hypothetical protein